MESSGGSCGRQFAIQNFIAMSPSPSAVTLNVKHIIYNSVMSFYMETGKTLQEACHQLCLNCHGLRHPLLSTRDSHDSLRLDTETFVQITLDHLQILRHTFFRVKCLIVRKGHIETTSENIHPRHDVSRQHIQ